LIAISGYAFANLNSPTYDFLCMALELSASRCLRKPFTPVALPTVVKRMLVGKPLTRRASQLRQGVMRPGWSAVAFKARTPEGSLSSSCDMRRRDAYR
jgi:hypothetical protein